MVTLNTGSQILGPSGENKTFTSVSTNIVIQVGPLTVGAIKSMSVNEQRAIAMIDEVGTDGHIDSVPQRSTDISGDCTRVRFNNLRMLPAFGRGFIHIHAQRIPFDIQIIDRFAGPDVEQAITTVIKNVWIERLGTQYQAEDFIITDTMSWKAEAIYSFLGVGGNVNAAPGVDGGRNITLNNDSFEKESDRGLRRGALNGFGLLQAISGSLDNA